MTQYNKLIAHVLKWEGGWGNDPADKGGPTMKGVTIATYTAYCAKKGRPIPTLKLLKGITKAEWEEVFKTMFWDRWKADQIKNLSIANLLVDWVWTSGIYGIKFPLKVLGVTDDGVVGPLTLSAINNYPNQKELFDKLWLRRKLHFISIANSRPGNQKFLKGWLNRLNDLKYSAE